MEISRSMVKPKVTMPNASSFNEMTILDLKQVGDKYVLWCMDSFTRFIQGKLLNNKKRDTILNATDECWNIPFGKPTIGFYADDDTEYEVKIENLINTGITMNYDPTAGVQKIGIRGIQDTRQIIFGKTIYVQNNDKNWAKGPAS